MSITILKAGLFTTIQDAGRFGYLRYGVSPSGAMDQFAMRVANILVGNPENEAIIESTYLGPTIKFNGSALISICGPGINAMINGILVPSWRPIYVRANSVLTLTQMKYGYRAYLAVAGGLDVEPVLGSLSTHTRSGLGGLQGKQLQKHDCITLKYPDKQYHHDNMHIINKPFIATQWSVSISLMPDYDSDVSIKVMLGNQFHLFTEESRRLFFNENFIVSTHSDRMGYCLQGSELCLTQQQEMLSEPIAFGTIQVTHNGQAIILLADRQTVGGYPKIAQIASVDLPLLAQKRPHDTLSFECISCAKAQQLYIEREEAIQSFKESMKLRSL